MIKDILDQLGFSRYYSTLDLISGYILMTEKRLHSTHLMGITSTTECHLGLDPTLPPSRNVWVKYLAVCKIHAVYLDDILIYGRMLEDHNNKLTEILERLREHNL